jgi:hypothetical protein
MALLEAVVLPQDYRRLPCDETCVLCGYGIGVDGDLEGVKVSVVMQGGEEDPVAPTPHARSACCCAWPADVLGAATTCCWAAGPVQTTTTPLPSKTAMQRPVQKHAAEGRHRRRRRTVPTKDARNVEHVETQQLSHIAAERNRRRQMNQYFATLRGLMPRSYARRVRMLCARLSCLFDTLSVRTRTCCDHTRRNAQRERKREATSAQRK